MKVCSKCPEKGMQELSEFCVQKTSKDGLSSRCRECKHKEQIKYRQTEKGKLVSKRYENSEKCKAKDRRYESSEKGRAKNKKHAEKYPDRIKTNKKKYADANKDKTRLRGKLYRQTEIGRVNNKNKSAKRRAQKLSATIQGYDVEIKEIYKNCPEGYHIDHAIPLNHPNVCGLHVPWNLQYLTAEENLKKSNKLIGE